MKRFNTKCGLKSKLLQDNGTHTKASSLKICLRFSPLKSTIVSLSTAEVETYNKKKVDAKAKEERLCEGKTGETQDHTSAFLLISTPASNQSVLAGLVQCPWRQFDTLVELTITDHGLWECQVSLAQCSKYTFLPPVKSQAPVVWCS